MSRPHTEVELSPQTYLSQELDREMGKMRRDLQDLRYTAAQAKAHVHRIFSKPSVRDKLVAEIKNDMALDLSNLEYASGLLLESERREIGIALRLYIQRRDAPKTKNVLKNRRTIIKSAEDLAASLDVQQPAGRYIVEGYIEEGIEILNFLSTLQKIKMLIRDEADDLAQTVVSQRGAPRNIPLHLLIGSAAKIYIRAGGHGIGSYHKPIIGAYEGPLFRLIIEMLRMAGDVPGKRFGSSTVGQQAKIYMEIHGESLGMIDRRTKPDAKVARKTIRAISKASSHVS